MSTYEFGQSRAWIERASRVIPCGIYGHFSPAPCVPIECYPFFAARAEGSRFWDVDGNEFIDYMCAYGPMVLGYANPTVEEAYRRQMKLADAVSLASPRMVELAELLVELVPVAEWAFFAKNGADATNYAVMVARAATGRRKIVAIQGGYHGTTPWMQAPGHHGTLDDDQSHVLRIPWNDVAALERTVAEHSGQIAAMIATPYHHPVFADNVLPADGYWTSVQKLLNRQGIVLIVDDVRCGFRLHLGGSCEYFGFKPDLICFSKAIANGYALSALVGTDALRDAAARVFHTGSFWFTAGSLAAALACLAELKRINAPELMCRQGQKLLTGMVQIAKSHGLDLRVSGHPAMPYLRIADDPSLMLHQDFCGECTRRGAYFTSHHNWFLSTAHTDEDLQRTWDIVDDALTSLRASGSKPCHWPNKS
jgi:glutamate-1-semialdehyde 2,1-aminomutase